MCYPLDNREFDWRAAVLGAFVLVCLAVAVCCGGCIRTITYVHRPDQTVEARYTNIGFDTSVDGLTIHKTADTMDVQVTKYNSQTQAWEAANKALDLAAKVAK